MLSTNCPDLENFEVHTRSVQCNEKSCGKVCLKYYNSDDFEVMIQRVFNQNDPIWKNEKDFPSINNLQYDTPVDSYDSDYRGFKSD